MKTKDQIIYDMCMTTDHSFGLPVSESGPFSLGSFGSFSLNQADKDHIRRNMAQLFEHHIQPLCTEIQVLTKESEKVKTKLGDTLRTIEAQKEIILEQKQAIAALKKQLNSLKPSRLESQIEEVLRFKDGWLGGGEGVALNKEGLQHFNDLFDDYFFEKLPVPSLAPDEGGQLSVSWRLNNEDFYVDAINLTVNLESFQATLDLFIAKSKSPLSRELNLLQSQDWNDLNFLVEHFIFKHS